MSGILLFGNIRTAAMKLRGQAEKTQLQTLTNISTNVEKAIALPLYQPYKKLLTEIYNYTRSLSEGIVSGEAGETELLEYAKDMHGMYEKAGQLEADAEEKKAKDKEKPEGVEDEPGSDMIGDKVEKTINKYEKYRELIPKRLMNKLAVKRLPVVLISEPPLNLTQLSQRGLSTDSISMYPVILNQKVVGMDWEWIATNFKGNVKNAIEYVLKKLEVRDGRRYIQLGSTIKFSYVLWMWIGDEQTVNQMHRCSPTKTFQVRKWGFPVKGMGL